MGSPLRSVTSLAAHGGWLDSQLLSTIFFLFSQHDAQLDRCRSPLTHKCHPCTFSYLHVMIITVAHRSPSQAGLRNVLLTWKLSQLFLMLGKLGLREETLAQMQLPLSEVCGVFSTAPFNFWGSSKGSSFCLCCLRSIMHSHNPQLKRSFSSLTMMFLLLL